MADQNIQVSLSFRDEASGKFVKATNDMIATMRTLGMAVSKEGNAAVVNLDKMGVGMQKTGSQTRYLNKDIGALAGSIGSLRNMILVWMFALRPIMDYMNKTTKAAIEQEQAERRLTAAFLASGKGNLESTNRLKDYASQLQKTTAFADEDILQAQATLATYKLSEKQIRESTKVVLNLATAKKADGATDVDLATTARLVGMAINGKTMQLERMIGPLDMATKKSGDYKLILEAINKVSKDAASNMAGTFQGQTKIMKNALGELSESLGNIIIKNTLVMGAMSMVTDEFFKFSENVEKARTSTDNFASAFEIAASMVITTGMLIRKTWRELLLGVELMFAGISQAVATLTTIIYGIYSTIKTAFVAFSNAILQTIQDMVNLVITIAKQTPVLKAIAKDWKEIDFNIQPEIKDDKVEEGLKRLMELAKESTKAFINSATKRAEQTNTIQFYKDLQATLTTLYIKSDQARENIRKYMEDAALAAKKTKDETRPQFDMMYEMVKGFATSSRDALADGFFKLVKGDFEGLKEVVVSFGDALLKTIMQAMATRLLVSTWLGSFLGYSGGATTGSSVLKTGTALAHTGGYIFANNSSYGMGPRRKYHSGGEVNATLLEGEGVLNRSAMRSLGVDNLNKLNRGENSGGTTVNHYYIQTIDEKSFADKLREHGDIYAGAVNSNIRDNGSSRNVTQRGR